VGRIFLAYATAARESILSPHPNGGISRKAIPRGFLLLAVGVGGVSRPTAPSCTQEKAGAVPGRESRVLRKQHIIDFGKRNLAAGPPE
jgi:hypothetical protein